MSPLIFDSRLSTQLCLTFAHSLWQVAILAAVATAFVRVGSRNNLDRSYAIYVAALLLGMLAVPCTFLLFLETPEHVVDFDLSALEQGMTVDPRIAKSEQQMPVRWNRTADQIVAINSVAIETDIPVIGGRWHEFAPWMMACYALGVLIMMLRLFRGIWKSQQLVSQATPITAGPLHKIVERIASNWKLRVVPALAQTHAVVVPQVVGFLRPTVLLPASAMSGLTVEELEMILAHELAHVRRYDMWVNLVQRIAEAILFFNPAIWYLSHRVSSFREYCCDEQTCRGEKERADLIRVRYAQALLRVVELSGKNNGHGELAALAATGSRPSELRRRVARLFGEPLREPIGVSRSGLMIVMTGIVLLFAIPVGWQNAAALNPGSKSVAETQVDPGELKVEVVAIGRDGNPRNYWDAEGHLKRGAVHKESIARIVSPQGEVKRRVSIRIDGADFGNNVTCLKWDIIGASTTSGDKMKGIQSVSKVFSQQFVMSEPAESFDMKVGVAVGEWKTVVTTSREWGKAESFDGYNLIFARPVSAKYGAMVSVAHNVFDKAFRIVGVDKSGQIIESPDSGGTSNDGIYQASATFYGKELEEIDQFEFQTRDYKWFEFKGLPMEPHGQVAVDQPPAKGQMVVKVVDSEGKPIQGVHIRRNYVFKADNEQKSKIENETYITNEQGQALVNLPGKSEGLRLWARKKGYVPLFADWHKEYQTDGDQIPATFEFRMNRGTKISGVVHDSVGMPIKGVKVEVVDAVASQFSVTPSESEPGRRPVRDQWIAYGSNAVFTDAEGRWEVDELPTDAELVFNKERLLNSRPIPPVLLKFSHPDYETIDGIDLPKNVVNPELEHLRAGQAVTAMRWIDREDTSRANAVNWEDGEAYQNGQFAGHVFQGQHSMVAVSRLFAKANFRDAVLDDVRLEGSESSFDEIDFSYARILNSLMIGEAAFQRANFSGATLDRLDARGGDSGFQLANFEKANLKNTNLQGGVSAFQLASFRDAVLRSSRLSGEGASFQEANFDNASLAKTLIVCPRASTAFQQVSLNNTEFIDCHLSTIDATALGSCVFDKSTPPRYDAKTKFPKGFDPVKAGWKLIVE